MPKLRIVLEDVTEEQAELIRNDIAHLSNVRVTIARDPPSLVMPELTPEQQKAFEEEWSKPAVGHITCLPDPTSGSMKFDPGPAIGEHLTDIDAPEMPPGMPILPPGWSQDVNSGMITDDHGQAQGIPLDWSRDATAEVNERYTRFRDELEHLINSFSMENGSDTPDFMLAAFMVDQLMAFDALMQKRDGWYGGSHRKLKGQLEAESAHTEAANAEIERLNRVITRYVTNEPSHTTERLDPTSHPD